MASLLLSSQASSDARFSSSAHRPGQRRAVPGVEVQAELWVPAGALSSCLGQQVLPPTWGPSAKGGQPWLWWEVQYELLDRRGRKGELQML